MIEEEGGGWKGCRCGQRRYGWIISGVLWLGNC